MTTSRTQICQHRYISGWCGAVADRDAELRPLALRFREMRPPCFPTVFEALVNAVACQQLSLDVGVHLLNRLARRFGPAVPGTGPAGQYGFPVPVRLAAADPAELQALRFSRAKARTITGIAETRQHSPG